MRNNHFLYIDGEWSQSNGGEFIDVTNPATEDVVGQIAKANNDDITRALTSAQSGFDIWSAVSPWERARILRKIAILIGERREELAAQITLEIAKPMNESRQEVDRVADVFLWCSEEVTRLYGRLLPQRSPGMRQLTMKVPIGPVAAFSPWNFPAAMTARKIAAALGAGCSIIVKPAEEAPAVCCSIVQACHEAGIPKGALNMLFGNPAEISEALIASPVIRKISLTGSIPVGRKLSSLAGKYLKPATMELGGHAPVIICKDANIEKAAEMTAAFKFRNAGQVCLGVGRIFVHQDVYRRFLGYFVKYAENLKVGDGGDETVTMGPLVTTRGMDFMERLVSDATALGARVVTGGSRIGSRGYFWEPTVLVDVPDTAAILNEEPFGPIVPILPFSSLDEVLNVANHLSFGLAGYAFTDSLETSTAIADKLEAGWIGINTFTPALSEAPFGGMKDSGIGYEGGPEGFDAFTKIKFISQVPL